ncbi:hypothetical protein BDA96_05G161700 [Sorghum bicolor]|uniref:Uncharacterized protein n=2 Tax=Sorghum bicolor TaxID=4558 RepID=A0A921QZ47_SORBI|nr:hypothetical protein BDA96_05G161700 [Sorghum bicolor]KXG29200.2 hypothetical protein SORBI_3005G148201 [Sorghum bicolor]
MGCTSIYTLFLIMSSAVKGAWRIVSLAAALFLVLATMNSIIMPCQGARRSGILSPIADLSPVKRPLPQCHTDKHCLFNETCWIYCRHHHYGLGSYCQTTFLPFVCCCLE